MREAAQDADPPTFAGCKQAGNFAYGTASRDGMAGILDLLGVLRARYGGLGVLMVRK
jgi:hypothetical protein